MPTHSPHLLLVEPDLIALHQMASVLAQRHYTVTRVTTVAEAASWLSRTPIDLLLASTRIPSWRAVELIASERARRPDLAAVLVGDENEGALEMDARRHGFAFLVRPFTPDQLLMVVAEQLAGIRRQQRWPRKRLNAPVLVRIAGQNARLIDVSYGGVGFEVSVDVALPSSISIEILPARLRLDGEVIWSACAGDGRTCRGGVALAGEDPSPAWRRFVDTCVAETH